MDVLANADGPVDEGHDTIVEAEAVRVAQGVEVEVE